MLCRPPAARVPLRNGEHATLTRLISDGGVGGMVGSGFTEGFLKSWGVILASGVCCTAHLGSAWVDEPSTLASERTWLLPANPPVAARERRCRPAGHRPL